MKTCFFIIDQNNNLVDVTEDISIYHEHDCSFVEMPLEAERCPAPWTYDDPEKVCKEREVISYGDCDDYENRIKIR